MEEAKYSPMVVAAARALADRHAEQSGNDKDRYWSWYGEVFYLADAQAALDAAGVGEAAEGLTKAAGDVLAERKRQIEQEGWTPEHDDEHGNGELAFAGACYAQQASGRGWLFGSFDDAAERYKADEPPDNWPDSWDTSWWRPKNPRRDLVRAAALLLAEIERLDRAALSKTGATE